MRQAEKFRSTEEYFSNQPADTARKLRELRSYILEEAPDAEERINYNIPAFALVNGGKRDQQIMIAGFKTHVGFYPTPPVLEHFENDLKDYKRGKGSVQFPLKEGLPKELICRMVRYRRNQLLNYGRS